MAAENRYRSHAWTNNHDRIMVAPYDNDEKQIAGNGNQNGSSTSMTKETKENFRTKRQLEMSTSQLPTTTSNNNLENDNRSRKSLWKVNSDTVKQEHDETIRTNSVITENKRIKQLT